MAVATAISQHEFEAFLAPQGFVRITLPNTEELVYAKVAHQGNQAVSIRVYSSINPSGDSRDVGKDAIRVNCWVKVDKPGTTRPNFKNVEEKRAWEKEHCNIVKVGGSKRVHRVAGWKNNLQDRLDAWQEGIGLGQPCPKCGRPTILRNPKKGQTFKPFFGCSIRSARAASNIGMHNMPDRCFACNRPLRGPQRLLVDTRDDQQVYVGPDCYKKIKAAGENGYQPPLGGPKLYLIK